MALYIGKTTNSASLIATTADENFIKHVIFKNFAPKIGSIKLVARSAKHTIPWIAKNSSGIYYLNGSTDEEKYNFKGWVYMDGSKYSKESFPKAYEVFGNPTTSTTYFQVPSIDCFLIPTNKAVNSGIIQHNNQIIQHQHSTSIEAKVAKSGKIVNGFSAYVINHYGEQGMMVSPEPIDDDGNYQNATVTTSNVNTFCEGGVNSNYLPAFHNGCGGNNTVFNCDLVIDAGENFQSLRVSTAGSDEEIWPYHIILGAMVYIGTYKY